MIPSIMMSMNTLLCAKMVIILMLGCCSFDTDIKEFTIAHGKIIRLKNLPLAKAQQFTPKTHRLFRRCF